MSSLASRVPLRREWVPRAATAIEGLPAPAVLGGFVVVQWLAVLGLALTVRHEGWIYYQGGDQLWFYTLGWLLGHGELGRTSVGYGLPVAYAPIARAAGPNLVSALPAIVLLNVLVLLPAALLALYGIAARIGGRLFGYWALVVWIAVPFIGIRYTNVGYHQKYTELLLPQAFGLTALADFPTMVAVVVSVYFCVRVVFDARPQPLDAVAAGLAAGIAIAIKPSAALFLVAPLLAFAYRRRLAPLGLFVAAILPAALALAVWKERGLGNLPLFGSSLAPHPVAAGASLPPVAGIDIGHYLGQLDWSRFAKNLDGVREHFWSARVIEWLVVAGLIAVARRSRAALLLVGGWFAAFLVVKGSYAGGTIEDGSLFRLMMPAFPAFVLLLASLPLLLPGAPARLRPHRPAFASVRPRTRLALLGATLALSALVPLVAVAAADPHGGRADAAVITAGTMPVPANVDLGLTARAVDGRVVLRWRPQSSWAGPVFYRVWRGPDSSGDGFTCQPAPGARSCLVQLPEIGVTRAPGFSDRPRAGRWVYRVAVAANWLDDPTQGDIYLVGKPVTVVQP